MVAGATQRPARPVAGGSNYPRRATSEVEPAAVAPTIIKLGGELLETPARLRGLARALAAIAAREPLVVVHGGGREVAAEMARLGIAKRAVDGLRITDAATLEVVAGVLAGRVNTRLVAALGVAGARAVGLTGADARLAPVRRERRYRSADGQSVDLGYVGRPVGEGPPTLLTDLLAAGYTPVVASLSAAAAGQVLNVNADTLAGDLAARIKARRLLIAGSTAGVLDEAGKTIPALDDAGVDTLIRGGQASAGMVAKLLACRAARAGGAGEVAILDARRPRQGMFEQAVGTKLAGRPMTGGAGNDDIDGSN
ncbi:MAG: acetylglutamate kinase [Acidobacteria bacterium]|nr:acetylglutamate kinase [Acidobacteriota bacterium]